MLNSIKKIIPLKIQDFIYKNIVSLIIPSRNLYKLPTYSQAGEDAVLRFLFFDIGLDLSKISYLDIGARHPTCGNNTFLFYSLGSKGVCVDADIKFIPLLKRIRPRDEIINVGISDNGKKFGDFYFLKDGGSTFDKKEYKERINKNNCEGTIPLRVPLLSINTVIKRNFAKYPDLLSIDVEGLDLPILKSLDFKKYPIPVICVETCVYSASHIRLKDKKITKFLISKDYEVYADTYINTIYVNREWYHRK